MWRHMLTYTSFAFTLLLLLQGVAVYSQQSSTTMQPLPRPGRYVPELHGANRGRYMPDDSGKYRHIKVPYNGGYGDRGEDYVHDVRPYVPPPRGDLRPGGFALGDRDHLRFSIDFNTDGSGWQIVQFEWLRDGDETKLYNYAFQNQLWTQIDADAGAALADANTEANAAADAGSVASADVATDGYDAEAVIATAAVDESTAGYENTNVHVDGEYEGKIYNVSYTNDNMQNAPSESNIQSTISEVLDYIQKNVLPTLS